MAGRLSFALLAATLAALPAGISARSMVDAPPRIVAAVMRDADGDSRADRVRLTYSVAVRHRADRDGRYPFTVAGYRLRGVAAASRRSLVLLLVEQKPSDATARPSIYYRAGRAQPVTAVSGRQAATQLFRPTRPFGHAAPVASPRPPPAATSTPTSAASVDSDGDGTPDSKDCGPRDP